MANLIATLQAVHDLHNFDCGNTALNQWLQQIARQHQKKSLSQTYVLVDEALPSKVLGFYSVSQRGLVPKNSLPIEMAKRLPGNIPALTLGRLAVGLDAQGLGYGEDLLTDAMLLAKMVSPKIGGWALFVDAKDDRAAAFYAKYGFITQPDDPLVLFIRIADIP